ncbi:hypothetical protein COCON_G00229460 [Conger conger]|uniref:Vezatin n=1 Tax=Conger conger TaxID=82655 RepID=A0A9Q1CUS9_CONCO|nr:hypothetical protein COCON_G00229460 [Conger conger]
MTEEFHEEVEFKYLQDLGRWDLGACGTGCREEEDQATGEGEDEGEGPPPQDGPASLRRGALWRVAEAVWGLFSAHQSSRAMREEQQLDAEFRRYSLRLLLEQDVFLQEDLELMELLHPGVLSVGSASSPPETPPGYSLHPRTWHLWTVAVLVAVLAGLRSVWDGQGLSALLPWVLVLVGVLLVRGAGLWRAARLRGGMRDRGELLESLAQDSRALTGLVRRALRLVQETEVISRGFTLLLDRVSAACPLNRAEPQLLGLRKASYRSLHAAFRSYRHATRHMLSAYPTAAAPCWAGGCGRLGSPPLNPACPRLRLSSLLVDEAGHYLCTVPERDLGLGLGEGRPSDALAQELTDDYGLPALKVLFQLFVGQSSEFFRRLALLLSAGLEGRTGTGTGTGGRDGRLAHRAVAEVTAPLRLALCGCLGDLQRSYDFHRCFETRCGLQGSDRAARARQQCRELCALHASVRSLQLHLRALLNEVISMEDELEKLLVSRETAEEACARDLRDRLRLLQPHMQASRGCWEETLAQDRDPVPQEQELEAYASDSDSDSDWRGRTSPLGLRREESRPVLLELKSVLGLRASEGERQKWKQLLFRDQAALRTTLPTEPCGSSSPPEPYSQQNNHEGPAPCSTTDAARCRGGSEGARAAPVPGEGPGGGAERDRAPPGGRSLRAAGDGPARRSDAVSLRQRRGDANLHG